MIGCLRTRVRKQPITALYPENLIILLTIIMGMLPSKRENESVHVPCNGKSRKCVMEKMVVIIYLRYKDTQQMNTYCLRIYDVLIKFHLQR